jgi:antitoxin CcdA
MGVEPARKSVVNQFVDADLLDEAGRMNTEVSETPQQSLRGIVQAEPERLWLQENREAVASINAFIDRHGLCADHLRLRPQPHLRVKS